MKLAIAVANTTDPQSRMMPTRLGFVQGYNAQVAVTGDHLIAAVDVNQQPNDMPSFVPMMTAATDAASGLHARTGSPEHRIGVVLADAGYCSNKNLEAPGPDRIIALGKGREQHAEAVCDHRHRARRRPGRTSGKRWPIASEPLKDQPHTSAGAQPSNPASEPSRRS
ncbi:hypothetical protein [Pseudarthrobacter phenanthrenivorans]|uniref:hypothetical protein n=1 Tax=Pseudarthrobacter phenanthrenivorans TaxID=361575 RepID=UPI00217E0F89|nr:hypothetical protein [Pseudarthrobacter phenanthrenivorans]